MNAKTTIASIFTLGILSGFLVTILLAIAYSLGYFSWVWLLGGIIAFNVFFWLIGPIIQDLINKWLYKTTWLTTQELEEQPYYSFVKDICKKNNIPIPKFGVIDDRNPTAFTYGSGAYNARIVLTKGLSEFLTQEELEAVIAHEVGHIRYRDFITMTVASTILQILYAIYMVLIRTKSSDSKKGNPLVVIAIASLIFYYIGTYLVLFLSRTREYAADAFAARYTSADALSTALIKIAYGILNVPEDKKTQHLLRNTRAQGIYDVEQAYKDGLAYQNAAGDADAWAHAMLFDLTSPWAWLLELKSTHPLVAKRIRALASRDDTARLRVDDALVERVDMGRQWSNFFTDAAVVLLPKAALLVTVIFLVRGLMELNSFSFAAVGAGVYLLSSLFAVWYRFPRGQAKQSVVSCMTDPYSSPVRGQPVVLQGEAVGKGNAGAVFSEDLQFRDSTGLIYLNYVGFIPLISNLVMAFKKYKDFLGVQSTAKGWFYRRTSGYITLKELRNEQSTARSYPQLYAYLRPVGTILLVAVLVFFLFL